MSNKLCECGCKQETTSNKWGYRRHYIKGHAPGARFGKPGARGADSGSWRGGKTKDHGYDSVLNHCHRRARPNGYVPEHIIRAENALGKPLPSKAIIHHADGSKGGPLVICQDQEYHFLLHLRMRALRACGHVGWRKCPYCKKYDDIINMRPKGRGYYHSTCEAEYSKQWKQKRKALLKERYGWTGPEGGGE
jgi:hypothetical protein